MLPAWSGTLRNLYFSKRVCRPWDSAGLRKAYRKIAVEKKRLLLEGVPYIELHLVCRYLTNPRNENSSIRLQRYYRQGRLFDGIDGGNNADNLT